MIGDVWKVQTKVGIPSQRAEKARRQLRIMSNVFYRVLLHCHSSRFECN